MPNAGETERGGALRRVAGVLLVAAAAGGVALSTAAHLASHAWALELASHLRAQVLLGLTACAMGLGLIARWPRAAVLVLALALPDAWFVLGVYAKAKPRAERDGPTLRVTVANLWSGNTQRDRAIAALREKDADVFALLEVTPEWAVALSALDSAYPYREVVPRPDNFGIALLSRLPFDDVAVHRLGPRGLPAITALVRLEGRPCEVVAAHPVPPFSSEGRRSRDTQLDAIAELATRRRAPLVLAGDLNVTPYSPAFRALCERAGLVDSRTGFGVQPTWPTGLPFLARIPIDHVLVSHGVGVRSRATGPDIGSDHLPVTVDLVIP